jgi:hypothetical protein
LGIGISDFGFVGYLLNPKSAFRNPKSKTEYRGLATDEE